MQQKLRLIVYPEYVEIHINNIPNNMLKRNQETKEPAFSGLHTFTITSVEPKENKNDRSKGISSNQEKVAVILHIKMDTKHQSERNGQKETRAQEILDSSNSGGAEGNRTPVRRQLDKTFSERSLLFTFPQTGGNKHSSVVSSVIMHGMRNALHTHVLYSNHTRARLVDLPGRMGA